MEDHNKNIPAFAQRTVFDPDKYRSLLNIDPAHSLLLADSKSSEQRWDQRESHLLRELDSSAQLVAHYRIWEQQSNQAPYRRQRGWEKYSPQGDLLDREVRYSRRDNNVTLH